jgi:hypothetical protein
VAAADFSGVYPLVAVVVVLAMSLVLARRGEDHGRALVWAWALLLLSAIGAHLAFDPTGLPGMRRATAVLAAIYALVTVSWLRVCHRRDRRMATVAVALVLILGHHLVALPRNYAHLSTTSPHRFDFTGAGGAASGRLRDLARIAAERPLQLECADLFGQCRLAEIYAGVAGWCLWNDVTCHQLTGFDPKSQTVIPLEIRLWESYYWPH